MHPSTTRSIYRRVCQNSPQVFMCARACTVASAQQFGSGKHFQLSCIHDVSRYSCLHSILIPVIYHVKFIHLQFTSTRFRKVTSKTNLKIQGKEPGHRIQHLLTLILFFLSKKEREKQCISPLFQKIFFPNKLKSMDVFPTGTTWINSICCLNIPIFP